MQRNPSAHHATLVGHTFWPSPFSSWALHSHPSVEHGDEPAMNLSLRHCSAGLFSQLPSRGLLRSSYHRRGLGDAADHVAMHHKPATEQQRGASEEDQGRAASIFEPAALCIRLHSIN
jgi:hypothetical protein